MSSAAAVESLMYDNAEISFFSEKGTADIRIISAADSTDVKIGDREMETTVTVSPGFPPNFDFEEPSCPPGNSRKLISETDLQEASFNHSSHISVPLKTTSGAAVAVRMQEKSLISQLYIKQMAQGTAMVHMQRAIADLIAYLSIEPSKTKEPNTSAVARPNDFPNKPVKGFAKERDSEDEGIVTDEAAILGFDIPTRATSLEETSTPPHLTQHSERSDASNVTSYPMLESCHHLLSGSTAQCDCNKRMNIDGDRDVIRPVGINDSEGRFPTKISAGTSEKLDNVVANSAFSEPNTTRLKRGQRMQCSTRTGNAISMEQLEKYCAGLPSGVWYDRVEHRYVVQCNETTACGRKKRRYFGVSRYGEAAAKQFAIAARLTVLGLDSEEKRDHNGCAMIKTGSPGAHGKRRKTNRPTLEIGAAGSEFSGSGHPIFEPLAKEQTFLNKRKAGAINRRSSHHINLQPASEPDMGDGLSRHTLPSITELYDTLESSEEEVLVKLALSASLSPKTSAGFSLNAD